jgi:hypothetical protein
MDRLKSTPDRDSDMNGGDRACTFKHRLVHFNPCKGLALLLKLDYYIVQTDKTIKEVYALVSNYKSQNPC